MIESEKRAEYSQYIYETKSPLSRVCDSADALGPLVLKEKIGITKLKLSGDVYYSRFRPGDSVEIRTQDPYADLSLKLSDNWKVESVTYPAPGKIEVVISGPKLIDMSEVRELFLFKASSAIFNNLLMKRLDEVRNIDNPKLLGLDRFDLKLQNSEFRALYENLNATQKNAVEFLISHNLSGAIQGPPGTGKTQLLEAVISLALNSNMRVCVTSFTNAAVDNLLGRIINDNFDHDWMRIGSTDRVRKELYSKKLHDQNFVMNTFKKDMSEMSLFGATLHKLAYNKSAPKVDLLVIDEAGQVPIYFWPFIQRLAKRIVLVGDQFQLPPVLAASHADLAYDNVFSLFVDHETPMLETQYRMRREIQAWSSEKFYKGQLNPHASVADRDFFAHNPALYTDGFVVPKKLDSQDHSKSSMNEANFIANKVEQLLKNNTSLSSVGIICPYRAQAGVVNATLQNRIGVEEASKILVDTVERFQGQEKEAIFLSFGVSGANLEELKFLSDPRRLNVSVTRAKCRFYCLFNSKLIERSSGFHSADLNEFLRWVTYGKVKIRRAA